MYQLRSGEDPMVCDFTLTRTDCIVKQEAAEMGKATGWLFYELISIP